MIIANTLISHGCHLLMSNTMYVGGWVCVCVNYKLSYVRRATVRWSPGQGCKFARDYISGHLAEVEHQ